MEKNKKTNPLLYVIILLLLIAIAVGIFLLLGRGKSAPAVPSATNTVTETATERPVLKIDESAGEYQAPKTEEKPETPGVAIPGWGSITIPPRVTELTNMVDFYNPEANEGYYYLTFELLVPVQKEEDDLTANEDENVIEYESIYASQLVPPGKHIQSVTLTHGMEPGVYDAIIHVQPYTMDDALTPTNNADMKTKLIVR